MDKPGDGFDPNKDDIREESIDEDEQSLDHQEIETNQLLRNFWCMCQLILIQLGFIISVFWRWLLSILADIGIRISRYFNPNGNSKHSNWLLTNTPLDTENAQTHVIVVSNDVPLNNDINEDTTLYDHYNNNATNTYSTYDEPNLHAIVRESVQSEAIDDRMYEISSSESRSYIDDEAQTDFNSDNGYHTENESDSSSNDDESLIYQIIIDTSDKDDNDEMSIISHITDNTNSDDDDDDLNISTDDGYDTKSENDASSEIRSGAGSEDSSINGNNASLLSDNGYETNSEDSSVNNNADERSSISEISCEINYENDQIDDVDDDRWSNISHITYDTNSEDDSIMNDDEISTDDGYNTKDENDSLTDSDQEDIIFEFQYNAPSEQKISTFEQSMSSTFLIDTPSDPSLTTETNADTLIKVENQETMFSTDLTDGDSIKQSSYINLNNESNQERLLLLDVDNLSCNENSSVSIEIPDDVDPNHNVGVNDGQIHFVTRNVDEQNDHPAVNNYQQGQPAFSVGIVSIGIENNAQLNDPSSSDEQPTTQILPAGLDQSSKLEEKAANEGEHEAGHEEIPSVNHPTSMQLEKQLSSMVKHNVKSSKINSK